MKTMRKIILTGIVLLPCVVFAGNDCQVTEYPDRYVATCVGEGKSRPESTKTAIPAQTAIPDQTLVEPKASTQAPKPVTVAPLPHPQRRLQQSDMDAIKAEKNKLILNEMKK